jgi:S-formylglutathione hydrolase FrmB
MGGYGALKTALRYPERFAAVGSMSAVTDIAEKFSSGTFDMNMWQDIFGSASDVAPDGNDLFDLAEKVSALPQYPKIIQFCGKDDYLLEDNRKLNRTLENLHWKDYIYRETPGSHNWEFWDRHIQDILKFFFKGDK